MLGWFIFLSILFMILWLLFSPIQLIIDSTRQLFKLRWKGVATAQLAVTSDDLFIRIRVLFWRKQFSVFQLNRSKKSNQKSKKKKSRKGMSYQSMKRKGLSLLKSFKVKKFRLNLDTDDFVQNSYIYPIFYFLNNHKRQLQINYEGNFEFQLTVENRLFSIIKSLIL